MRAGDLIAERFELEYVAGEGGMGAVWRARDRTTGGRIALKVMGQTQDAERFAREAAVLSELTHNAIVRYHAQGQQDDELWVAMEWLEGENLEARLARGPLGIAASLALGRRIAEALAAVHARGVVHRDVKPANILLPAGRIEEAKLIDFGIARSLVAPTLTKRGVSIGTPGYMAPEQARGERDMGTAGDVFSLGCVLYECIAGEPAFSGEHVVAILAKVLLQEAPRLSAVPLEVSAMVARFLTKDAAGRPADGSVALAEISSLEALVRGEDETIQAAPRSRQQTTQPLLSGSESHVVSVVLLRGRAERDALRVAASALGGRVEFLADGTVLALLSHGGSARDQAAAAARLALALAATAGGHCALATGRAALSEAVPVGDAIDRASAMLGLGEGVRVDDVTRGLLDARFELDGEVLLSARQPEGSLRTVLGRPVPFVGRQSELAVLEGRFAECLEERSARSAIVTAPAGVGKSRLLHELIEKLRAEQPALRVWIGRADSMNTGASLGILGDALRRALGVQAGEELGVAREKISTATERLGLDARVAWFLGEILGVPFDESLSEQISTARRDAQAMGDQMRRAFEDFILAECASEPLMLVLEDMHWGDASSASFVDSTMRLATEQALFVIATARPDAPLLQDLWTDRASVRIPLAELGKRAGEKLVRALCPEASAERITLLVERSAGNALFLEELVRAELEGRGTEAPGSVIAMLQSRLEGLPPELRRVLRAASVFGRTFWRGAIRGLSGAPDILLDALLGEFAQREIVVPVSGGRFPGEREYLFRHELMRDAAYAMLTDDDRALAHRHAASWLERAGETDASAIAEHFEKGAERTRAAPFWLRAANDALDGNDLGEALAAAERGIACGAEGQILGALRLVEAEACSWRGDNERAAVYAAEATALVTQEQWAAVASLSAGLAARLGRRDQLVAWSERVSTAIAQPGIDPAKVAAAARVATFLMVAGERARGEALLARTRSLVERGGLVGGEVAARLDEAEAYLANFDGDPAAFIAGCERAHGLYAQVGLVRPALNTLINHSFGLSELGRHAEGCVSLRAVAAEAERMGLHHLLALALHNLGWALARSGDFEGALRVEEAAAQKLERQGEVRMEIGSRIYLSRIALDAGSPARAETEARRAIALIETAPSLRPHALAALAAALRARDDLPGASGAINEAFAALEAHGAEDGESFVRLTHATILADTGDDAGAKNAIREARRRLLDRADKIRSPTGRTDFLTRVAEHANTLALCRQWTGEG